MVVRGPTKVLGENPAEVRVPAKRVKGPLAGSSKHQEVGEENIGRESEELEARVE